MQFRLFKLRFRRRLRKGQQQVEELGVQAEQSLEKNFFRRLGTLGRAWRFIAVWIGLFVIIIIYQIAQIEGLDSHYQHVAPVAGGTYTEGILGRFTNANPLFATSEVDSSVSKLLFAGLFTYDVHNHLIGDLASGYSVDDKGTTYTVHLRPNLTWQDGTPLTADDVVYTYRTIQNPDVQSPLANSWQGIKVAKVNAYSVTFTLTNPLTAFPDDLTNGIVPMHLLASIPATELRSSDFNTVHPIGAGPFSWSALQVKNPGTDSSEILIALKPFDHYHGGKPQLDSFIIDSFSQQSDLESAFKKQQLNGVVGLTSLPPSLKGMNQLQQYNLILSAATMTFFNTASPVLSDPAVRHALIAGTNVPAILQHLAYTTHPVNEPFLINQLGYNKTFAQSAFDPQTADATLDKAGWTMDASGHREKAGKPLSFGLSAADTPENRLVTSMLVHDWQQLGAQVSLHLQSDAELSTIISSNTAGSPTYDALLYGISIGVDPDVFVYWDSSQTDPRSTRLNLSLYKSSVADASLEAGRTRQDPALRTIKYQPFLQAWQQDAPAMGLYQPRFFYITNEKIYGLDEQTINIGTDRFNNVQNWEVRTAKVTNN